MKHFENSCQNIIIWTCIPCEHTIIFEGLEEEMKSFVEYFYGIEIKDFDEELVLGKIELGINFDSLIRYKWTIYYFDGDMDFSYILIYESSCSYIPCGRYSTQSNFDVTSYRIYKKNVAFWNHNNLRRVQFLNSIHVRNNTPYCIQRNW